MNLPVLLEHPKRRTGWVMTSLCSLSEVWYSFFPPSAAQKSSGEGGATLKQDQGEEHFFKVNLHFFLFAWKFEHTVYPLLWRKTWFTSLLDDFADAVEHCTHVLGSFPLIFRRSLAHPQVGAVVPSLQQEGVIGVQTGGANQNLKRPSH